MIGKVTTIFVIGLILTTSLSQSSNGNRVLPEHPLNGQRLLIDGNNYIPNTFVSNSTAIKTKCNPGYQLKRRSNQIVYCDNGNWVGNLNNICQEVCPLLSDETMDLSCTLNSKKINCSKSVEGTTLNTTCKPPFNSPLRSLSTCTNGRWIPEVEPCSLSCGGSIDNPQILYIEQDIGDSYGFPWTVQFKEYRPGSEYIFSFLGSLISQRHIVTAAHLFFENDTATLIDKQYFRVVAGGLNENMQIREIEQIIINDYFRGVDAINSYNIAVVIVNDFKINLSVQPVCIDYNNENTITKGDQGIVFGQGSNWTNVNELVKLTMTFESRSSCIEKISVLSETVAFRDYYTEDMYCGSYLAKNQCELTGSGNYVKLNGKYYIQGFTVRFIYRQEPKTCLSEYPVLSTNITWHSKWLQRITEDY